MSAQKNNIWRRSQEILHGFSRGSQTGMMQAKEAQLRKWKAWIAAVGLVLWMLLGVSEASAADEGAELATLRERVARLEETKTRVVWAGCALGAGLVAMFGFFFSRVRDGVKKRGLDDLVDRAIRKLLKEDESRLSRMFDGLREELTRKLRARDRVIGLIGTVDKGQVQAALERMGFRNFVDEPAGADVLVILGVDRCRMEAQRLVREPTKGQVAPIVLYTGQHRIEQKEGILDRLNEISIAIPANTTVTAAQHAAILLLLKGGDNGSPQ